MLYHARIDEGAGKSREETGAERILITSSCVYERTQVEQSVYPTVVRCFLHLWVGSGSGGRCVACVVSSTPRGFYSYYSEREEEGEREEKSCSLFLCFREFSGLSSAAR
jgi:hypothetical protein